MQNLETKLASKIVEEHSLRVSSQTAAARLTQLEASCAALTQSNQELQVRVEDLQALKGMADRELIRSRESKERLEEKLVDMRAKLHDKNSALEAARQHAAAADTNALSLQRRLEQEVEEKAMLRAELDATQEKLRRGEAMSFGQSGSGEAMSTFTEMQMTINDLQQRLNSALGERYQTEMQLNLERDLSQQQQLRMQEQFRQSLADAAEELATQRSNAASTTKMLDTQEETLRELQRALADAQLKCADAEQRANENAQARHIIVEEQSRDAKMSRERWESVFAEHRRALESKAEEVAAVTTALTAVKMEFTELQRRYTEQAEARRIAEQEMRAAKATVQSMHQSSNTFQDSDVRKLEAQIQTQRATLLSQEASIASLNSRVTDLMNTITDLEAKDQMSILTIEELHKSKRELEDSLLQEKAGRRQLEKRLADGLSSLDTTSRG